MDLGAGKGGRKPLDVAINLTAFIDLMAVTISFLIMTAVWTQVTRLQVSQAGGPPSETIESHNLPLVLTISESAYLLSSVGATQSLPRKPGGYDVKGLKEKLEQVRSSFPAQRNITVEAVDRVEYEDLLKVIDVCVGAGLDAVNVRAVDG